MDFTLQQYTRLLITLKQAGFSFHTFEEYQSQTQTGVNPISGNIQAQPQTSNSNPEPLSTEASAKADGTRTEAKPSSPKANLILRHDVDLLPQNSLQFARIQSEMGIKASYYFRIVPESFNEKIILEIASLGHEIGYHYETMDTTSKKIKDKSKKIKVKSSLESELSEYPYSPERKTRNTEPGTNLRQGFGWHARNLELGTLNLEPGTPNNDLIDFAFAEFCQNLETFRKLVPIKTICMHGSPRSKYDNRDIWKKYNYRDLGLIGEPYFDIDFSQLAYYTDTGRMWDGDKYSVRDKPIYIASTEASANIQQSQLPTPDFRLPTHSPFPKYHTTSQIIKAIQSNSFPSSAMFTFHPQRWTDSPIPWTKELISQGTKNLIKRWFFVRA